VRAPPRRARLRSIRLQHVGVRYGRHWALDNVSFEVCCGQRWWLTGPNGSGKTVLLKLLRGDLWPTPTGAERRSYWLGRERHAQPALARERIAYLGPERQDRYERYEWNLPVADVVATGLYDTDRLLDQPTARQRTAAMHALTDVGLAGLAARGLLTLSYGQRRRVLLARALVRRPDVLLLDEVLNGLDAASRRAFLRALRRATQPHTAWILSSHRGGDMPADVTHLASLSDGAIEHAGPVAEVQSRHAGRPPRPERKRRSSTAARTRVGRGRALIRLQDVTVYRDQRCVLPHFDWMIGHGEHWRITGPNGSGKSTLLAMLYGDLWPAWGGRISRSGVSAGSSINEWKRRVGYVSPELQATYAATDCTVEQIVLSGLHSSIGLNQLATAAELRAARTSMRRAGLSGLEERRSPELSYGQLRLALVARALVRRRCLLLLDEPFDGLDAEVSALVHDLVGSAVRDGAQLVVATHHDEDVPLYVRNTLALRSGRRPAITTGAPPRRR
jgi:molybdate transport system ATP-binding protein